MSSQVYTMKLVVDDSAVRALEARLNKIMGISGSGTASGSSSSSGTSTSPMANLGKLAKIATGIGLLVVAVQKIVEKVVSSSPALQAMLKILDMSITLILRPIGDFFAFFLKPILIMFLTKVALPFYKLTAPFMRWLGSQLGSVAAVNPGLILGAFPLAIVTDLLGEGSAIRGAFLNLASYVNKFTTWIDNIVSNFAISNIAKFIGFLAELKIPDIVRTTVKIFYNFFSNLKIPESITGIVKVFFDFFSRLKLPEGITSIVRIFYNFFRSLKIPDWILSTITDFQSFFYSIKIPQWVIDIVDSFFKFIKGIGDWLSGLPAWILGIITPNNSNTSNSNTSPNAQLNIYATLDQFGKDASLNIDGVKKQVFDWFNSWMRS